MLARKVNMGKILVEETSSDEDFPDATPDDSDKDMDYRPPENDSSSDDSCATFVRRQLFQFICLSEKGWTPHHHVIILRKTH